VASLRLRLTWRSLASEGVGAQDVGEDAADAGMYDKDQATLKTELELGRVW